MDLGALRIFLAVAQERSFSRAAAKVHRTQPAVSQAVRRLELELGEQLFDRSSKTGTLTDAGKVLQNYGQRLVRLAEEAESAMRELRDLRRGRVLIGANEAAVHTLLPLIARFRQRYPDIAIDVRRVPARQIAVEVQQGSLDFGALTFHPTEEGLLEVPVGSDELVAHFEGIGDGGRLPLHGAAGFGRNDQHSVGWVHAWNVQMIGAKSRIADIEGLALLRDARIAKTMTVLEPL
jgi:DNA-binding transcriptional LysR family regulator